MYILVIARGIPSAKDPMWGCFEFDQARALKAMGHKVVVLSVDERIRFHKRPLGLTHINVEGIDCYNYRLMPKKLTQCMGFNLSTKISFAHYNKVFKQIITEHGLPDIMYSHYLMISHMATLLKAKWNIPLVAIEHWSEINKDTLLPHVQHLGKLTYPHIDQLIAVSTSLQQKLKLHFGAEATVIHNMVGADFFTPSPVHSQVNKMKFVTTGSLIHRKGFDLLIAAFARLNLPQDTWELNIIGGGKEKQNLQTQINDASLQNNIHLLGQKTKPEIIHILRQSNVFLLPSRNENFSVAVLEALACGLPVIASICGGIRECIFDFNGLLFPVDDIDALANAIQHIITHYPTYNHTQIAEHCKNHFSPEIIAKKLTTLFHTTHALPYTSADLSATTSIPTDAP